MPATTFLPLVGGWAPTEVETLGAVQPQAAFRGLMESLEDGRPGPEPGFPAGDTPVPRLRPYTPPGVLDYVRHRQTEVPTRAVLDAVAAVLGIEMTGPDATFNVVDPGEDPDDLVAGIQPQARQRILAYRGLAVVDDLGRSSAWVNSGNAAVDAPHYRVRDAVAVEFFAAQEITHAYLMAEYDGYAGRPRVDILDNEVVGEAASSYVSPSMAAGRLLECVAFGTSALPTYGRLEEIGRSALEKVIRTHAPRDAVGAPVSANQMVTALRQVLDQMPATGADLPQALNTFVERHLASLTGARGYTPQRFMEDLVATIVEDLRDDAARIVAALEDGTYGGEEATRPHEGAPPEPPRPAREPVPAGGGS